MLVKFWYDEDASFTVDVPENTHKIEVGDKEIIFINRRSENDTVVDVVTSDFPDIDYVMMGNGKKHVRLKEVAHVRMNIRK